MKEYPSMEQMIADCEAKVKENEQIVFAIGAGRIAPMIGKRKAMEAGFKAVKECDGFIGVHPVDLWHTLLVFDTLNNAKAARNILKSKGMPLGQVAPIMVEKQYLKGAKE